MKKLEKLLMNNKIFYTYMIVMIVLIIQYVRLEDYHVNHSFKMSSSNYVETTLDIKVYKAFNNPYLYLEIAEDHNHLNGQPNVLKMNLYFFKWKYKTVIFNYDENLYYIKLEY